MSMERCSALANFSGLVSLQGLHDANLLAPTKPVTWCPSTSARVWFALNTDANTPSTIFNPRLGSSAQVTSMSVA